MREFQGIAALAALLFAAAIVLYTAEPFDEFWNDLLANFLFIFAAGYSAVFALLAFRQYQPADAPRDIWALLAAGLWAWTLAEALWAVYNILYGEVGVAFADLLWAGAYLLFGAAIYLQYQLLYRPTPRFNLVVFSLWGLGTLALTASLVWLLSVFAEAERGFPLWVAAFYPAADFAVGLAAANIVYRFRGGALGYPWLGLFVFAAADIMYAVLETSGFYSWSVNAGNLWSATADLVYLLAYLVVGLGCAAQWLTLKYGPIFRKKRKANSA